MLGLDGYVRMEATELMQRVVDEIIRRQAFKNEDPERIADAILKGLQDAKIFRDLLVNALKQRM